MMGLLLFRNVGNMKLSTLENGPNFDKGLILGGAVFGISFAVQTLYSLWQMWFVKAKFERRYVGSEEPGEYRRRGEG